MNTSIIVQNLKCGGCAHTIMTKLSALENISNLKFDIETSSMSFDFESIKDVVSLKRRLRLLGYPSVDENNSVAAKAMSFLSCATGKISKP